MNLKNARTYISIAIWIALLVACSPPVPVTTTPTHSPTRVPQTATTAPQTPTTAPQTPTAAADAGMESVEGFAEALRSAGATVEVAGEIKQPFVPVTGQRLLVNDAEVQVFEFADEDARVQVSDTISETGDQIGSAIPEWIAPPHFWAGGQLVVLYVGSTQSIIDLVSGVMGEPLNQPTVTTGLLPQAIQDAQAWLAEQLGTTVDQVEVVSIEHVEWSDSCLGLGQPNEICAQVITPGWRIMLRVDGKDQEVRTDETASIVKLATTVADDSLAGTQWQLVSFGEPGSETPVIEGSTITLAFGTDGKVSGSGGCNTYSGQYEVQGNTLSFSQVISTKRACAEEGRTQQEQQYFQALEAAAEFDRTGDQLTISFDDGQGVLKFAQSPVAGMAEARVLGILDFQNEGTQDVLTAPDTVKAGEDFELTILTFGGGCEREGDSAVVVTPANATVMVYDFTAATQPDVVCTAILKRLTHTITLRFSDPGEMVIQVWGRRVGPDTPPTGVPTILEHRVTVES